MLVFEIFFFLQISWVGQYTIMTFLGDGQTEL